MLIAVTQAHTATKVVVWTVPVELTYLSLLDAEKSQLWHTGGKDYQCSLCHCRLVQAELREAGRSRLEVQHHPSIGHFGLVQ